MACVKLDSDFVDYYDNFFNDSGPLVYHRRMGNSLPRGVALEKLRAKGVPIIPLGAVNQFPRTARNLVVYTDQKAHQGQGKKILDWNEANIMYPNTLASQYVEDTGGLYLKHLQVGSRRFNLTMQNPYNGTACHPGFIVNLQELEPGYNFVMALPIFSIDYIPFNGVMTAVDFNEVQNLYELGFERVMTPSDVVKEIESAIKALNLV